MGILDLFGGKKTLYFPGCLTKGILGEQFENYKWIFNKLGIDFILLPNEEVCCGLPVLNGGYKKDARKLAKKNFDLFKAKGIKKIITNCPSCYHTFKSVYPTLVRDWDIEVEHATESILRGIQKKRINFSSFPEEEKEIVTYHDPCHLGRYEGVYDVPREVIKLLGGKLIELKNSRENSICCGGGGGVRANFPDTAKKIANMRTKQIPEKAVKIISPCGLCFKNLESTTEKSEEFSNFVRRRLGR